ncbi:type VII secretion-associated serine protease mycosin [Streptomyces sp. O3]
MGRPSTGIVGGRYDNGPRDVLREPTRSAGRGTERHMASRRDELNAYTFAKRRLVAQFLRPCPTGTDEGAPKPLRGVLPSVIVAVVLLAAFGAWGMVKPVAPKDWDTPGANVIVASESTARYVVLRTKAAGEDRVRLHPVLNMSSAKLLLDPDRAEVVDVDDSVLDGGTIPHGATLGIPYAPDRLPDKDEAGAAKRWAVCESPGADGRGIRKAAFVLAGSDQRKTEGAGRLRGGELLYVQTPDATRYVVDAQGRAYEIERDELLLRAVVGQGRTPQRVTRDWLDTLHKGDRITFPKIDGTPGADAAVPGGHRVGMVLESTDGAGKQKYLVLPDRVAPVSDFTAKLLLSSRDLVDVGQRDQAERVSPAAIRPGKPYGRHRSWPQSLPVPVNAAHPERGGRDTVCTVLRDVDDRDGATTLSTWAGADFPLPLPHGASSAYVTPGSGQLYRQFQGEETGSGPLFLVTDTGVRYALAEARQARNRLGYQDVPAAPVPLAWSSFLPVGPRLSTAAARQPQGLPAPSTALADTHARCAFPGETYEGRPWSLRRVPLDELWEQSTGKGVRVAVIDTGVDVGNTQLAPNVDTASGRTFLREDLKDGNLKDGNLKDDNFKDGTTDTVGHGTKVAGIIAARPAEGTGFVGLAPDATIIPIRQNDAARNGTAEDLAAAIRYAAGEAEADVINISQHTADPVTPTSALRQAVDEALAKDVVIVASAGNDGIGGDVEKPYPASYQGVLAVAAADRDNQRAPFSQSGDFVGIAAPGVDMVSTVPGGGHCADDGTSFAAPYVAGVAALVRAKHPDWTRQEVVAQLQQTAERSIAGHDRLVGWGVVDPVRALIEDETRGDRPVAREGVTRAEPPAVARLPLGETPQERNARLATYTVVAGGVLVAAISGGAVALRDSRTRERTTREGNERGHP